jgi:hypothetical protein
MARLTTSQREKLPDSCYCIPERAPGPGSYPICNAQGQLDEGHARNALVRVSQYGDESEKARVRSAVKRKFPEIGVTVREHGEDVIATDHKGREGRKVGSHSVKVYRKRSS